MHLHKTTSGSSFEFFIKKHCNNCLIYFIKKKNFVCNYQELLAAEKPLY